MSYTTTYTVTVFLVSGVKVRIKGTQPDNLLRRADRQYGHIARKIDITSYLISSDGVRKKVATRTFAEATA